MSKLCHLPLLAILLICLPRFANSQSATEVAWQVRHNAGAKAIFGASDYVGNFYAVERLSSTTAVLNVFDPYGGLVKSYPLDGVVTALVVDPVSGGAVVDVSGLTRAYYWNGEQWDIAVTVGPVIGLGMDDSGRVIMLNVTSIDTVLNVNSGSYDLTTVHIPVVASSSYVDPYGRILLMGSSGNTKSETSFANFYSEEGTLLWSRTFSRSGVIGSGVAGFAEDSYGTGYLAINSSQSFGASSTYIEAIDPNNGTNDLWDSAAINGSTTLVAADATKAYIAGQNGSTPFIAAYRNTVNSQTAGAQAWLINQPAVQMTQNEDGPLVLSYDSTSAKGAIVSYDAETGSLLSSFPLGIPTVGDLGTLIGGGPSADYVGDTGGPTSTSIMVGFVYGGYLSSITLPKNVIGGSGLTGSLVFDQAISGYVTVDLTSSNPNVLAPTARVEPTSAPCPFSNTTTPVDVNTVVTVTGSQEYPPIRRTASITVLTAALSGFQINLPTLAAPTTANGQITLTGPAGRSGKTIMLSSNNPALTVPASFKIPANSSTGTFTLTSHPVATNTTATISASLGGITHTAQVTVKAPVLSTFTLKASSVVGGASTTGNLSLTGTTASVGTATVTCASPSVTVPATVALAAGSSTVSFTIATKAVTTSTTAVIKVTFGGVSISQTLTLTH